MEKTTNELMETQGNVMQATEGKAMFTTLKCETLEEKKAMYNAISNCDFSVSDKIGETIVLKDFIAHEVEYMDENTGEMVKGTRTVFIDDKGQSYGTISSGVENAMRTIIAIYGDPMTWCGQLKIQFLSKKGKGNNKFTTVKVV